MDNGMTMISRESFILTFIPGNCLLVPGRDGGRTQAESSSRCRMKIREHGCLILNAPALQLRKSPPVPRLSV
jgi:hypothetical protein